jgi:hypothetical protein
LEVEDAAHERGRGRDADHHPDDGDGVFLPLSS